MLLWAVHIADGVLSLPACLLGFVLAGMLAMIGTWGLRDEEVPRVGVLTSAFFIASSLRVPLPPSSVHLLLNGLVGILLGWRAALAIPLGLLLQAALLGHGGFLSLGVNACVMVIPALLASLVFGALQRLTWQRVAWQRVAWLRSAVVGLAAILWTMSLLFGVLLLFSADPDSTDAKEWAVEQILQPGVLGVIALVALVAAGLERGV